MLQRHVDDPREGVVDERVEDLVREDLDRQVRDRLELVVDPELRRHHDEAEVVDEVRGGADEPRVVALVHVVDERVPREACEDRPRREVEVRRRLGVVLRRRLLRRRLELREAHARPAPRQHEPRPEDLLDLEDVRRERHHEAPQHEFPRVRVEQIQINDEVPREPPEQRRRGDAVERLSTHVEANVFRESQVVERDVEHRHELPRDEAEDALVRNLVADLVDVGFAHQRGRHADELRRDRHAERERERALLRDAEPERRIRRRRVPRQRQRVRRERQRLVDVDGGHVDGARARPPRREAHAQVPQAVLVERLGRVEAAVAADVEDPQHEGPGPEAPVRHVQAHVAALVARRVLLEQLPRRVRARPHEPSFRQPRGPDAVRTDRGARVVGPVPLAVERRPDEEVRGDGRAARPRVRRQRNRRPQIRARAVARDVPTRHVRDDERSGCLLQSGNEGGACSPTPQRIS
mmetsp:Transcript_22583/g.70798  ORF Transcript_22583/g.70798 Transcript_22583/m.70798 type:complete len:466 (+) Transcript_22583:231-1628(+)